MASNTRSFSDSVATFVRGLLNILKNSSEKVLNTSLSVVSEVVQLCEECDVPVPKHVRYGHIFLMVAAIPRKILELNDLTSADTLESLNKIIDHAKSCCEIVRAVTALFDTLGGIRLLEMVVSFTENSLDVVQQCTQFMYLTKEAREEAAKQATEKFASVADQCLEIGSLPTLQEMMKKSVTTFPPLGDIPFNIIAEEMAAKQASEKLASLAAHSRLGIDLLPTVQETMKESMTTLSPLVDAPLKTMAKEMAAKQASEKLASLAAQSHLGMDLLPSVQETMKESMTNLSPLVDAPLKTMAEEGVTSAATGSTSSGAASTTSQLANGAQTTALIGVAVEGVFLAYTGYSSYNQMKQGKISEAEFRQKMIKSTGGAGGAIAGSVAGGVIGSVVIPIPVLGSFVGSVVGGMLGRWGGSWSGEQLDKATFHQDKY